MGFFSSISCVYEMGHYDMGHVYEMGHDPLYGTESIPVICLNLYFPKLPVAVTFDHARSL